MCISKIIGYFRRTGETATTLAGTNTGVTFNSAPTSAPVSAETTASEPAAANAPVTTPSPGNSPRPPSTLPHPEEDEDTTQTAANTPVSDVFQVWFDSWHVPGRHHDYWRNAIDVQVYDAYPQSVLNMGVDAAVPGVSWEAGGRRHYACLATWFNPGVTAHEQAHNSYALLTEQQKVEFSIALQALRTTDPLMVLMFRQHPYAATNDVETHAEIYRYIGEQMPQQLKQYYPRLFE